MNIYYLGLYHHARAGIHDAAFGYACRAVRAFPHNERYQDLAERRTLLHIVRRAFGLLMHDLKSMHGSPGVHPRA